jgi:NitT/TauT family transport system substrate-binding protein
MRTVAVHRTIIGIVVLIGLLVACAAPRYQGASTGAVPGAASTPAGAASPGAQQPASSVVVKQGPPAPVRAAFVVMGSAVLPSWIAADRGIYERYNLEVELIYIPGLAKISEALLAKEIDFGVVPAPAALGPGLQGADLVMIASWANKSAFSLYGQPSLTSVADLVGKRVSTTRRGSLGELWAAEVLARHGLQPERDYVVLPLGGQPEQLAGLQNGAVDAATLGIPTNILARKLGFRELLNYKDNALEYASVGLVTSRHFLVEQPEVAERFLKASAEGVAVMMQDTESSLAVLGDRMKQDDRELLEESLAFERSRTARNMLPTVEGLQAAMDSLAVNNPVAEGVDATQYADLTLVHKLNDSGFISSLYR